MNKNELLNIKKSIAEKKNLPIHNHEELRHNEFQTIRASVKQLALEQKWNATDYLLTQCYKLDESGNSGLSDLFFEQYIETILIKRSNYDRWGNAGFDVTEKLKDVTLQDIQKRGIRPSNLFSNALFSYLRLDVDAATKAFHTAFTGELNGYVVPHYQSGAHTVLTDTDIRNSTIKPSSPSLSSAEIRVLSDSTPKKETTIIITCDGNYFQAYSSALAESFIPYSNFANINFHIINSNKASEKKLNQLLTQYKFITATASDYSEGQERTYYATARFVLSNDFLKIFDTNLLFYDADIVFNDTFPKLYNRFIENSFDIGLNRNKFFQGRYPWTTINANCLAIKNNKRGHAFSELLSNAGKSLFPKNNTNSWWFDQNLLSAVFRVYCQLSNEVSVMDNFVTGNGKDTSPQKKEALSEVISS